MTNSRVKAIPVAVTDSLKLDDQASQAEAFWRDGYAIAPGLLSAQQCAMVRTAMDQSQRAGRMRSADNKAYRGPNNEYSPVLGKLLLDSLAPRLAQMVGRAVLPSYAFWRIYEHGAVLNSHKDRNACELSVTIAIAAELGEPDWPIGVTDLHGQDHAIALAAGTGLLYQGTQVQHWRDAFAGERHYQLFLHYVMSDGPFVDLAHDHKTIGPV